MTIHAALTHRTTYRYDRPIALGPHVVRLRPAPHSRTRILTYNHTVNPGGHFINWQQDPFGNYLARLVFPEKVDHFEVVVDLIAEMVAINPFDFFIEESAETYPFRYSDDLRKDLAPYLEAGPMTPKLRQLVDAARSSGHKTNDFLVETNRLVQQAVSYVIRMEPGVQAPEDTLTIGRGSCRDSGWLLVQLFRHLGLAARFVSGYLIQLTADQKAIDGPSGPEADFTDLHAWTEVYVPGAGWIGLDPTSGLLAGEGHIPLAATPAPKSAAPITGALEPAEVSFDFDMHVTRVLETPRETKPYTEDEWAAIDDLGRAIDRDLINHDVRLTIGGEPTFVAAIDRDAGEWNTEAVGPTKRDYADRLIRRLRDQFAPNGLLHYGQGKWYPGEQLPRWAFALYWRKDGEPLWSDTGLIAGAAADHPADDRDAQRFGSELAVQLGIDGDLAQPLFEDPAHFLMREQGLPENVDALDSKLEDAEERARLVRVFGRGVTAPAGFVLPIQAWQGKASEGRRFAWRSEQWQTRRGRLFLIPGDSPAGFRLPLGSLAYLRPSDYPHVVPLDPFAARGPLPARTPVLQARDTADPARRERDRAEVQQRDQFTGVAPGDVFVGGGPSVRTAITVEPRDGILTVFLPPVESADEYVDLIQAVEEAATSVGMPIHVEGYSPPSDPRLGMIKVTPDPGVIEVNVQPSHSWGEQAHITETLYEEARQCRLDPAKYMIDGRPTGTGGGNHVVVGGATPADSPFLRRPDLLASLIRYWQNHPSLSYLFSGLFIGPTSQAPRVDEARDDQLYELEIALRQVPDPLATTGLDCPPWLVDRIFRNLLVDLTGNTHRAEICIDKLYSPDGPTGRLGLVEFRAFEMPPHPRMSLAQQLVLRALIAWFWRQPYTRPLVRFGSALHDRFLLPHFIWRDFEAVLSDLSGAGYPFEAAWYRPHFEFRFPTYGSIRHEDITLELRAGLEPWHVLGEEGASGGTARYVDSSVERLQVTVTGALGDRYDVSCNGWSLPLTETDRADLRVAGVRFRAWQPASCLHPTIGVDSPLIFDLVDRWAGRSVAGCAYHVMHPGGRSFDTMPVNALEAEGRRLARFDTTQHTPGPLRTTEPPSNPEKPMTLDLRRLA